jgi:hypothetical protein
MNLSMSLSPSHKLYITEARYRTVRRVMTITGLQNETLQPGQHSKKATALTLQPTGRGQLSRQIYLNFLNVRRYSAIQNSTLFSILHADRHYEKDSFQGGAGGALE